MAAYRAVLIFWLAIFAFSEGFTINANSRGAAPDTCGYGSCNPVKDDMINVHLVPHTHDDVGWLMTVDQYYYREVQYILDSVIPQLEADPNKRFIYVEVAFFARWFREQGDYMRHTVKRLVNEGRLEFILGGWCMNDEASTHYNAIIDQHTLGFEFLRENFGECGRPRVGWQIDPFGHSRETASIFARFGFDSLFFGRLDYQDKEHRENTTTMEMIWRGSPNNLGSASDLFTGVLPNGYGPPGGFCFDIHCQDDPIVDDPRLHDNNVKSRVDDFLKAMADQAKHYNTNHLIATMGSDFQYQAANNWFKNLDKLIKYVNERQSNGSKVNLLYSTPSCYTWHVNKAGKTYTTKEDDFFPYAHQAHGFWTGYFTSRPALKGYVRKVNNFYQTVKQLDALAILEDTDNSTYNIRILGEALGVAQHHDAVSGTEKQVVTYDYAERLANGVTEGQKVVGDAMKKLLPLSTAQPPLFFFCTLTNISQCSVTEKSAQFQVTVYNPVARAVNWFVRLPVTSKSFAVTGPDGKPVAAELWEISKDTVRIPERNSSAPYDLVFPVSLPPLGFSVFFVKQVAARAAPTSGTARVVPSKAAGQFEDVVLEGKLVKATIDSATGLLKSVTNVGTGLEVPLSQTFLYYVGHPGNNSQPQFDASGAYIFRPNSTNAYGVGPAKVSTVSYRTALGKYIQEVYQEFSPWVSQTIRVYQDQPFVEFQWTVGPIPIDDKQGKEVISRFSSNVGNDGVFYTDSNGREMLKRVLNHRDTWQLNQSEPVAGNYYPVNSRIYIKDAARQLTVMTDRSQGGASLRSGEVELMVHRRLLYDDAKGVGEALNETGSDGKGLVVRGSHYVLVSSPDQAASLHRDIGERLYMAPQVSLTAVATTQEEWSKNLRTTWSGVRKALPSNVHLLTLEQFPADGPAEFKSAPPYNQPFLLRLEHMYETGEDAELSKPVTVDIADLFAPFTISEAVELTLGANLPLDKLQRLTWKTQDGRLTPTPQRKVDTSLRFEPEGVKTEMSGKTLAAGPVTLSPMEIRTFQISIAPPAPGHIPRQRHAA